MSCKRVVGKDFVAIQCSGIGGYNYLPDGIMDPDKDNPLDPYANNECDHSDNFDNRGVLKCTKCGAEYDENRLAWI